MKVSLTRIWRLKSQIFKEYMCCLVFFHFSFQKINQKIWIFKFSWNFYIERLPGNRLIRTECLGKILKGISKWQKGPETFQKQNSFFFANCNSQQQVKSHINFNFYLYFLCPHTLFIFFPKKASLPNSHYFFSKFLFFCVEKSYNNLLLRSNFLWIWATLRLHNLIITHECRRNWDLCQKKV